MSRRTLRLYPTIANERAPFAGVKVEHRRHWLSRRCYVAVVHCGWRGEEEELETFATEAEALEWLEHRRMEWRVLKESPLTPWCK